MSCISIKIDYVKSINSDLNQKAYKVLNMKNGTSFLVNNLDNRIKSRRNINSRLNTAIKSISEIEIEIRKLKALIDNSADKYALADKFLVDRANFGLYSNSEGTASFNNDLNTDGGKKESNVELFLKNKLESEGSYINGGAKIDGDVLGIDVMAGASGELLGYEASLKNSVKFDMKSGEFGVSTKGELAGHVAKGEIEGQIGLLSGSIEGEVVTGAISAEAKAVLFDQGVFDPQIKVKGEAEVVGIKATAKGQFGTDDFNVHTEVEGCIGVASAEGEFAISKKGATVGAEVGAAVFKGEAKSGFEIFGIKVDLSVEGEALAVGAKFGAAVKEDSFELGGKLSFLAGLGGKIKISW